MNSEMSQNSELSMPPTEPSSLPPLPWQEGIELVLARYERRILDHALEQANGVKRRAALLLGISRYALRYRMSKRKEKDAEQEKAPAAAGA